MEENKNLEEKVVGVMDVIYFFLEVLFFASVVMGLYSLIWARWQTLQVAATIFVTTGLLYFLLPEKK